MPDIANPAYHPEKKSVGELLAMTNPAIIVPDWQRNFSWKSEHIDTFWNDLLKFLDRAGEPITSEYFFGSIVLVGGHQERVLLLDGQQRLATSTILLAAARDALLQSDAKSAEWVQKNYLSDFDPIKEQQINKLRLNVYDRDFFQRIISQWRGDDYVAPEPDHASHYLIREAKSYFDFQIANAVANLDPTKAVKWVKRIVLALTTNFTVIAAYSENENSAAEVFETLNDRGIGLSTPDLLRNLIIKRGAEGQQEQIVARWEDVISFRTDAHIKAFLRHHWVSRYGDVKSQSLYREVKSTVEEQNIDSLTLSTELRDSARLYRRILDADFDDEDIRLQVEDVGSFGAGAAILLPAFLSIFDVLKDDAIKKALRALVNVYVRDGIVGGIENSVLENRFYRAARNLRKSGSAAAFSLDLAEGALSDDEFRNRFSRLSLNNNGQRRYILRHIEMAKRATGEVDIAAPHRVHVEHIYPQTPPEGQRWQNHERWVNRLGNLSLLDRRLNSGIKNGLFAAKKPSYEISEILLTKELCAQDGWDSDRVAARQAEMAGVATAVWPVIL